MNIHFIQDNGFLNNFIEIADELHASKNIYIYLVHSKSKSFIKCKKVQSDKVLIFKYKSKKFNEFIHSISNVDRFIFHFLSDDVCDFILRRNNTKASLIWIFWGADFYSPFDKFANQIYDNESIRYFRKHGTQTTLNNSALNLIKKIYSRSIGKYVAKIKTAKKEKAIARINFIAHYNVLDYNEVKKHIQTNAKFLPFFYFEYDYNNLSGIRESQFNASKNNSEEITIQLGNSASLSNNHIKALVDISKFKKENLKLLCPLSYGDMKYGNYIEKIGTTLFNKNFIAIRKFITPDEYKAQLNSIDIAIMNHIRAESAGNVFTLIAMNKTIYMNDKSNLTKFLMQLGITIKSTNSIIDLNYNTFSELLDTQILDCNRNILINFFSRKNAILNIERLLSV